MSARFYTAEELISSARAFARIPDTAQGGTADADVLRYLNEELKTRFLPRILAAREEFFHVGTRIPLVASTSRYAIPARALGGKVQSVVYIDGNGNRVFLRKIPRLQERWYSISPGLPTAYYMEWNSILLVPPVGGSPSGSLEVVFPLQASELVLAAGHAGRITSVTATAINVATGAFSNLGVPTAWQTSFFGAAVDGEYIDIHAPESGAALRVLEVKPSAASASDFTVPATDIDGSKFGSQVPQVGDFVCLRGQCAVPPMPRELHPTLAKAAAAQLVLADGDSDRGAQLLSEVERDLSTALTSYLADRVEEAPEIVINRSSFIHGRSRGNYYEVP